MKKTILSAFLALALSFNFAFAQGPDPAPERADPTGTIEDAIGECLTEAGLQWVQDVNEYERVRYVPGYFYFGSHLWVSRGSEAEHAKVSDCYKRFGITLAKKR